MIVKDNKLAFVDSSGEVIYFLPRTASTDANKIVEFTDPPVRLGSNQVTKNLSLSAGQSALFTADTLTIPSGITVTLDDSADLFIMDPNIFQNFSEDNRHGEIIQTVFTREDAASQYYVASNHPFPGAIITPLETKIKPKYTTSLIMMEVSINGISTSADSGFRIVKDGELITTAGYEGYNNKHHPNYWGVYAHIGNTSQQHSFIYFDKPATTNELRYGIAFGSSNAPTSSMSFVLNDVGSGPPAQGDEQGVSIIKLSEIYQKS